MNLVGFGVKSLLNALVSVKEFYKPPYAYRKRPVVPLRVSKSRKMTVPVTKLPGS